MQESALNLEEALQHSFTVGDWHVEPEINRLTEITEPHFQRTLEPRLMRLLCFLAANSERVLTRDQLTCELWPRVIVNDNSLTRAVSELRKQLTLPGRAGTDYVQTIPKRGYRLVCTPKPLAAPASYHALPSNPLDTVKQTIETALNWRHLQWATTCLMLGLLAINFDYQSSLSNPGLTQDQVFYDQVVDNPSSIVGGQLSLSALTDLNGNGQPARTTALSPDGTVLAFVRYEGELSTIYLIHSDSEADPVAVFSSENYVYNLSWSPVGNALLFARQPSIPVPALLNKTGQYADLVMLDLDSLSLQVLIDSRPQPQAPTAV